MPLFHKHDSINDYLNGHKKKNLSQKITELLGGFTLNKDELYEELTVALIESDLGVETSESVMTKLKKRVDEQFITQPSQVKDELCQLLKEQYHAQPFELPDDSNTLIMMVGVNGSGKTTSISKLIGYYQKQGKSVGVIAGDTFRAGAVAQIEAWAEKLKVPCVAGKENSDPSSVLVDGCRYYQEHPVDLIIADTAGRLQNKANLMKELEKMVKVTKRELPQKTIEVWLVLDATTGQNGLSQAEAFVTSSQLSGLVLTKMDGTSKGGIALAVNMKYGLPIRFLTYGENLEAIKPFEAEAYIDELIRG